ncbi:NAD(P)/FAD-dependent oxidoreductase [Gracilinema caldarium]|uniref:FAD-dependent pyridine nucleotide-disulfide oxidoreductase n=1 Tax=Gracilinema caldarium (strain ATCC 51460 / DSM 7334 / H1) TaxID=744872 RepID=F8F129_GRAC1|nr:FAD-dependent oxidoreductase [Gracilinema caldarium]AEJ20819.1 FAD-dependent pyridine nucleotide-disulfide oxidoreductase [Gracilinema caldarium DSM 7334]
MKELRYDAVVIGGGAAGMAAALEIDKAGFSCAIVEREDHLGGILMQCIHNGFGLHEFKEELTGPEFAERFAEQVAQSNIVVYLGTTVTDINAQHGPYEKELICASPDYGIIKIISKAIVLAMGCRERNRGNVRIPGARPAGVYTAGLAQRLVNIEGYIPGKEVVIIGSGDIGLIMARRMSWVGCHVKAVVEIMPYPSGLTRNIVQCLHDFNIPLYLSCQTTNIFGNDRVEGIEVTPMENGALVLEKAFRIDCDTVLLSVGLVPENELSKDAGVELHPTTNGPIVDASLMTNVDGIFACGNVLHVHDLVDWVAEESRFAGRQAAAWLRGERPAHQVRVKAGPNVRYANPGKLDPSRDNKVYLRSMIVKNDAVLELRLDNRVIKSIKKGHIQPSEMITLTVGPKDLEGYTADSALELALL